MITLNESKLRQLLWWNLDSIARGHSNEIVKYFTRHHVTADGNVLVEFVVEYAGPTLPHETCRPRRRRGHSPHRLRRQRRNRHHEGVRRCGRLNKTGLGISPEARTETRTLVDSCRRFNSRPFTGDGEGVYHGRRGVVNHSRRRGPQGRLGWRQVEKPRETRRIRVERTEGRQAAQEEEAHGVTGCAYRSPPNRFFASANRALHLAASSNAIAS